MVLRYFSLVLFIFSTGCLFSYGHDFKTDYKKNIIVASRTDHDKIDRILTDDKFKADEMVLQPGETYYHDTTIILDKKRPFGLKHFIYNFEKEDYYHISVWRFGDNEDGVLVADGFEDNKFYNAQNKPDLIDSAGWQLLTLDIFIPPYYDFNELRIYAWNKGTDVIMFKNLKIERLKERIYPSYIQSALKINIDEPALEKLEKKRELAFKNGVLETEDNDYVKVKLIYAGDTMKAKVRLKGDWLDHLIGPKWSFRVKMGKNDSWKNMTSFSLQTPVSRGFLYEWFTHKVLISEDVLTTRYGFVPVILNGKSLGIYAYEEHFDRHLIEANKRREGPILKFSEEVFWTIQRLFYSDNKYYEVPIFSATDIVPFKANRTVNDKTLFNEYLIAQNLLYQFKNDLKPLSEIFDIRELAKFYALSDITKAYHGFSWHNVRFYYNPVMCRLEPVAFDLYTSGSMHTNNQNIIIGNFKNSEKKSEIDNVLLLPFRQKEFVNQYIYYLNKYTKDSFIDSLYNSLNSELDSLNDLIGKEFRYYQFDISLYKDNCKRINDFLQTFRERAIQSDYGMLKVKKSGYARNIPDDLIPYLIKVYRNRYQEDSVFYIDNFCRENIQIAGFGNPEKFHEIIEPAEIPKESFNYPFKTDHPDVAEFLIFKVGKREGLFSIPVFEWNYPYDYTPLQELFNKYSIENYPEITRNSDTLIIEGAMNISRPIVIPGGYTVTIKAGTKINFTDRATFISYSPVYARGNSQDPIIITSSDGTAMGFNVFETQDGSVLEHVIFDQLNTLDYNGWTLTGAVNFYESDVNLINVKFINNRCEDALNVIRSKFTMTGCSFDNIFQDAFDSDFSEGIIQNSLFRDIANDAIDFSGSKVDIKECEIINTGDKGISCGEKSELMISNIKIDNSNVAVACKDLSSLSISGSLITNCKYSFIALVKKSEYGEAEIHSINNTFKNIFNGYMIEEGSIVFFDNIPVPGIHKKLAKEFY
jgi:hypothetical protein